ncbi:MAG: DUF2961 domain-containing protein, partial [Candidatus Aminicenantes bacterium]|nr:DUF2961 domain-containing protein [Candidatus Aminicenantes bacterium]
MRKNNLFSGLSFLALFSLSGSLFDLRAQDLTGLIQIQPGRARAVTSADPNPDSNADRIKYVAPGETMVLADIKGPAVIRHIWLTFSEARPNWLEAGGSARPDEIVLRMYWDGDTEPAVEAPLSDFFGAGFGLRRELISVPVQVEGGDGYNCYWPMPFHTRGLITITNEGSKNVRSFYYHIDYTENEPLSDRPRLSHPGRPGRRPLCRNGAVGAVPQPPLVRRRRRQILRGRRKNTDDPGHGHRGLFPDGLGPGRAPLSQFRLHLY